MHQRFICSTGELMLVEEHDLEANRLRSIIDDQQRIINMQAREVDVLRQAAAEEVEIKGRLQDSIRDLHAQKAAAGICLWSPEDTFCDEDNRHYVTACKRDFIFTDGDTRENGFKFCPFCGRAVEQEEPEPETQEEDEKDHG